MILLLCSSSVVSWIKSWLSSGKPSGSQEKILHTAYTPGEQKADKKQQSHIAEENSKINTLHNRLYNKKNSNLKGKAEKNKTLMKLFDII